MIRCCLFLQLLLLSLFNGNGWSAIADHREVVTSTFDDVNAVVAASLQACQENDSDFLNITILRYDVPSELMYPDVFYEFTQAASSPTSETSLVSGVFPGNSTNSTIHVLRCIPKNVCGNFSIFSKARADYEHYNYGGISSRVTVNEIVYHGDYSGFDPVPNEGTQELEETDNTYILSENFWIGESCSRDILCPPEEIYSLVKVTTTYVVIPPYSPWNICERRKQGINHICPHWSKTQAELGEVTQEYFCLRDFGGHRPYDFAFYYLPRENNRNSFN